MCGITGYITNSSISDIGILRNMVSRLAHRGPDDEGGIIYQVQNKDVGLGQSRLSIIDLSIAGHQPMEYNDYSIVYNGEIYNFQTIKINLVKLGYEFRTTSDTEVICAAYLEYGENCVSHFNGMFAFVIYDVKKQLFFGARDRLGQKPFYYYHNGRDFEFSSQISSIQLHNDNLTISSKSINYFLLY